MERTNLSYTSANHQQIVGYIIATLVTISGGFFIYHIIVNSNWTFAPNWNMFSSVLIVPLYIVGIGVMFANWSKFSFSQDTYIKTTYRDGTSKTEKSYDITDVLFGRLMLPLLGRFVIVPLFVSAAIYYPIMCIVWLVGSFLPWIVSTIIVGIIALIWIFGSNPGKNLIIYSIMGIIFTIGFALGAYYIYPHYDSTPNIEESQTIGNNEESFNEIDFENIDIDESEFE